jgi:act minimal PKS chain-length factor (CLF/KS beta)
VTAVITGIGIVAPNGIGADAYWAAALAGTSGIAPITRFDPGRYPVRLAGQVTGADPAAAIPARLSVQTDRWTHLGLHAAELALADAGADPAALPEYEMAVVTGSSSGGTEFGQREIEKLWQHGPGHVGAYQSIAWFYAATTGQISIRHQMRGPCGVIATEQAGGLDAIGQARRLLRADARLVVTGGTDASLCPYGLVAQLSTGLLSRGDDPAHAFLPFDAAASGYLPGEGGAILIAEDSGHARARNAPPPYGEVAGYAAGFDPPPGSGRPPALARVIRAALADSGLAPADIGVVFADAAGVPELDAAEATAISSVFGPGAVPVTAPKTLTGRLYAGGAALDVATALLALRHRVIPATAGVSRLAPGCRQIDLVRGQPRPLPDAAGGLTGALVLARGFGGFNAAVVLCTQRAGRGATQRAGRGATQRAGRDAAPQRRGNHHEYSGGDYAAVQSR